MVLYVTAPTKVPLSVDGYQIVIFEGGIGKGILFGHPGDVTVPQKIL